MKAWRFYGKRDLRLEEISCPEPKEGEVLLKVTLCGICQTDVDEFMAGPKLFSPIPIIPGHEFGGIVTDVGPNVSKKWLGKTVMVSPLVCCQECKFCKAGLNNLCENLGYYGIKKFDGGFAEYVTVKVDNLIESPIAEIVHFGEILLVARKVLTLAEKFFFLEKEALICGAGPVGLITALLLKKYGWSVEICEIREQRRKFANDLGIRSYAFIHEIPKSFSIVIDCAGEDPLVPHIFPDLISKLKHNGTLILVGLYFTEVTLDVLSLLKKEIKIIPCFMYSSKVTKDLIEDMVDLAGPMSKMSFAIPFENLIDGLIELETNKDKYIKLVVTYANH